MLYGILTKSLLVTSDAYLIKWVEQVHIHPHGGWIAVTTGRLEEGESNTAAAKTGLSLKAIFSSG